MVRGYTKAGYARNPTQTKAKTKTDGACHREKKAHFSAADREGVRFFFTTPTVFFAKFGKLQRILFAF
jgi:hypothetical protein